MIYMRSLYHMTIVLDPSATEEQLIQVIDLAKDWFKYGANNWLVWSAADRSKWKLRLEPLVKPKGSLVIHKSSANRI